MAFINPVQFPVAASEAATRQLRDQAAAAAGGGHPQPVQMQAPGSITPTAQQTAQVQAEKDEAINDWRRARAAALETLVATEDPVLRLLLAAKYWFIEDWRSASAAGVDHGLLPEAFPELWDKPTAVNAAGSPWDTPAVVAAFVTAARHRGARLDRRGPSYPVRRGLFGSVYKPVWMLPAVQNDHVSVTAQGRIYPLGAQLSFAGLHSVAMAVGVENDTVHIPWPKTRSGQPLHRLEFIPEP
jgi:hypothetical protein